MLTIVCVQYPEQLYKMHAIIISAKIIFHSQNRLHSKIVTTKILAHTYLLNLLYFSWHHGGVDMFLKQQELSSSHCRLIGS